MGKASEAREEEGYDDNPNKKKSLTRYASDGQQELTIADTELYQRCEEIVKAKAKLAKAKDELETAEDACIEEMRRVKKTTITHKGDTLVLVEGSTRPDHIRFKKQ